MGDDNEPGALMRPPAERGAALRRRVPVVWRRCLAVFAGGAAGTGLRGAVSGVLPAEVSAFPWAVWAVNVSGSLVLAYLATRFLAAASRPTLTMPLLCVGLLGSYTTFSTFAVGTVQLAAAGRAGVAVSYAASSVVAGLAAAWLGIRLAEARG